MSNYITYATPPQHSVYGDPSYYQQDAQYHPAEQAGFYRDSRYEPRTLGTPMTPSQAHRHASDRRSKSPKPNKRQRKAKTTSKGPVITGPLSEVTKDYKIPVKDMEAWVNRPAEERRKEAEKKGGYVARPMNSFMMYRSAYSERVKQYCSEQNHQVVSQVSGASWPQEPKTVREYYEKLAQKERENHQKAHPDYKFAPNKNANAKKRKTEDSDDDDDPDWRSGRSGSSKRTKSEHNSARSTPFDARPIPHQMGHASHPSSWDAANPGRPMPHMAPSADMHGQYYQPHVTQYAPHVEDIGMRRVILPGARMETPLVGMPGGAHHELLQPHSHMSTPVQDEHYMMDPALYSTGTPQYAQAQDYAPSNYQYGPSGGVAEYPPSASQPHLHHPGMQTLTGGQASWPTGIVAGNDFDTFFSRTGQGA